MHINKNLRQNLSIICQVFEGGKKQKQMGGKIKAAILHNRTEAPDDGINCMLLFAVVFRVQSVIPRCGVERPRCGRVHLFCDLVKQKLHLWSVGRVRVGEKKA